MTDPSLSVRVLSRFSALPAAARALLPAGDPFLNAGFIGVLEDSGVVAPETGWQPLHLMATRGEAVLGLLPLYLKSHSHGDFIYDWNWAPVWTRRGHAYYPRLLSGVPYTPAGGARLLVAPDLDAASAAAVRRALIAAAKGVVAEHGLSTWHVALPDEADAAHLAEAGLLLGEDVQFHWHDAGYGDFAGFLAAFSAANRRKVRAERRRAAAAGLTIGVRHGDEVAASEWPALHALYRSTFDRFGNHAALTVACLQALAQSLGERMVVMTAADADGPVALSLCLRSDTTLYGRYWGARRAVDCLHFELCFYQGIEYCLRHGLTRFEPGAGGEHKLARGFVPQRVYSAHWIPDPSLRAMLSGHLLRQRDGADGYRAEAATHLPYRQAIATPSA